MMAADSSRWGPMAIIVLGIIGYHVAMRGPAVQASPILSLVVAYATALVVAVAMLLVGENGAVRNWKAAPSMIVLGLAVAAIEIGFVFAYRGGWRISTAALTANAGAAVCLVAVGALLFREPVTVRTVLGAALAIGGVALMTRG